MGLPESFDSRKPGQGITQGPGFKRYVNPAIVCAVIMEEYQGVVAKPEDFDLPLGEVLPGGSGPVIIADCCFVQDTSSCDVGELDEIVVLLVSEHLKGGPANKAI